MPILGQTGRLAIIASLASSLVAPQAGAAIPGAGGGPSGSAASLQDRKCAAATFPKALPEIAAVVDADTLRRAIAAEIAGSSTTGAMLFSVRFDRDGQIEWVERIGNRTADAPLQARVAQLIGGHMKTQASAREPWSFRLQVVSGDSVQLLVSRSELCPVERIAGGGAPTGSGVASMSMEELRELQRAGRFRVGVDVSATGSVLRVELLQSSGSRFQDDFALQGARAARYRPALVDGIPVAARYEIESGATARVRTRSTRRSPPD